MTQPAMASTNAEGQRVYKLIVPVRDAQGEVHEQEQEHFSVSQLLAQVAKPGLEDWKQRTIVQALATSPELRTQADRDPRGAARKALAGVSEAANFGMRIHALTVEADKGDLNLDSLDGPERSSIEGYLACRDRIGWAEKFTEATVALPSAGYAGTMDRLLWAPGVGVIVADVETGREVYPDVALQLAAYVNAEWIWDSKGRTQLQEVKGLRTDIGWVIHVRPEGTRVVEVNLRKGQGATTAFGVVSSLCCLWKWQHRDDILPGPEADQRAALIERIEALKTVNGAVELVARNWPRGVATFKGSTSHTTEDLALIDQLLVRVEAKAEMPF